MRVKTEAPVWSDLLQFAGARAMRGYSPGRGRKKAIKKFTIRKGLWMAVIIAAGMIVMLALFLLGVFRLDAD
jgi:hypothetical protein